MQVDYKVQKIKALLKEKNITQQKFSDLIGVSVPTIRNWFYGRSEITINQIEKIARVLGVPVGYFFGESGAQPERAGSTSDCEKELAMLKTLIQEKTERIKLLEQMIAMLQEQCRGRGG